MGGTHAVVIGASFAGMCAARVLRESFDRVTVVERDALEDEGERAGVPQSRHVHALLVRGRREIEGMFPGFGAEMARRGALDLDAGNAFVIMRMNGWEPRKAVGLVNAWGTRLLFEASLRARFRALCTDVEVLTKTAVRGLVVERNGRTRVKGVCIEARGAQRSEPREHLVGGVGGGAPEGEVRDGGVVRDFEADLVVDATGRGSKAPDWLRAAGIAPPRETVVDSFMQYASMWFEARPRDERPANGDWQGIWIDPFPPSMKRAGVLFPCEDNRWVVTVAAAGRERGPENSDDFHAFLRSLRSPLLARAVEKARPISPLHRTRSMTNRLRHFDAWPSEPAGFVALGDAACAFNPIYGQGMSTNAVCARVLQKSLRDHGPDPERLPRAFHRAQGAFLAEPWVMATGADFMWNETVGERPPSTRLMHPYVRAVMETAIEDPAVRQVFAEIANMLRPASDLMRLGIVGRVGVRTLRRRLLARWRPETVPDMPPG
jgi:2-polyprenyl-6-methoxyphenol hydroxylase-like FAD-dependent oxidoreductase